MDRSDDPEISAALDEVAPDMAMDSRRQHLTGSATGVGSVGFEETGAFDVGDGETPDGLDEP